MKDKRNTEKARNVLLKQSKEANEAVLGAVSSAYSQAGSYAGAAKILNEGDITPIRSEVWTATKVMRVLNTAK